MIEERCDDSDRVNLTPTQTAIMKYVGLLGGGKDSCFNLPHRRQNGHELVTAASLRPLDGNGSASFPASISGGDRFLSLPNSRSRRDSGRAFTRDD